MNSGLFAPADNPDEIFATLARTQPQFSNNRKIATTEFVQRALGNFQLGSQIVTSTTLTAANTGSLFQVTNAGVTVTLPAPSSALASTGATFTLFSNVATWTLASGTANIFNGSAIVSSMSVPQGTSVTVSTTDGLNWFVMGTGTLSFQNNLPVTVKAWVNFNGTGTVAIRAAYNVSSITDNGTGDYTVNFATPLVDANFVASGLVQFTQAGGFPSLALVAKNTTTAFSNTSLSVRTVQGASLDSLFDPITATVSVVR